MSDKHTANVHSEARSGGGLVSQRLVLTLFFSLVLPIVVIGSLVTFVTRESTPLASEASILAGTAQRIQKIGSIQLGEASHEARSGEDVFKGRCSACHGTGALGSPKFGDAAAWGPRIVQGFDTLLQHALHGKGNMTPQGGGDLSDYEIARGLVYMANAGGAKFPEPKAPATDAAAPAADAAKK